MPAPAPEEPRAPASEAAARERILEALRGVQDPDLHQDIVSLGFVEDLEPRGPRVSLTLKLTTPACPYRDQLVEETRQALLALPGVEEVQVDTRAEVAASRPLLSKQSIPGVKNVLAVSSGKGGVGKTTVAVNLACALSACGARVGILDADVYGPNVPLMLGITGKPSSGGGKILPFQRHGVAVMSMGLLVDEEQPVIWRGPMLHGALRQFLFDVAWEDLDYLVVDLPPGTGDAQLSLAQQAHLVGAVVVTTPQDVSILDVKKAIGMFRQVNVPLLGIVENMAGFVVRGKVEGAPAGARVEVEGPAGPVAAALGPDGTFEATVEIFGSGGGQRLQERFQAPLLGRVPLDPAVRVGGDTGRPVVLEHPDSPAARAFGDVAGQVAARISTLVLGAAMQV